VSDQALLARLTGMFREKLHLEVPSPSTDLLEGGILDSLTLVDLLLHLEADFDFPVALETLDIDRFRTLESIAGAIAASRDPAQ